ncbi:MAG: 3-oxoacyl-ACP reductase FabG [Phycisphaeraceae bacterium]|nr:3-oxoacyl-ACP reductase FabG [Phycisphaeraceae bacterium]
MILIDLTGKTALVTGASQGIGAEISKTLHRAGANVVINYFDDPQGNNVVAAQKIVAELGDRAICCEADVRNAQAVQAMVAQAVATWGSLDIVVNNAGIIRDRTLKKMTHDDWDSVISTNLTGVFHLCKAAEPVLADEGRIINIASIAGVFGFFGQSNYAAAKAGVIGLTKVLSRELARRKITVNAVAPGMIHTPMAATVPPEVQAKMIASIPLGAFGEPQDIAHMIAFLCRDLARYITGQTLHVNGGWHG